MKRAKLLLCMLLCLFSFAVNAQEQHGPSDVLIDVTIVDKHGDALPGATIKVSGRPVAVVSDIDGKVSLWVHRGDKITVSYLGMQPRVLSVNKPLGGNLTLDEEENTLEQVVVTGYQKTTKRRITGSVTTISAQDLKGKPLNNLDMMLQGKVAGVDIKAISGRPGESAKIRIRGTNTITGNADPLWVVDGVPLQRDIPSIATSQIKSGDFSDIFSKGISGINPNDIESVTVLKDASAAAIYGSRAAGGVIVITTKRGSEGKMRVSYSSNLSLTTSPSRSANLMNSREKLAWEQELWDEFSQAKFDKKETYPVIGAVGMIRSGYGKYAGLTREQQDAEIAKLGESTTDWFKQLFRNSVSHSHYLSLSGGGKLSTYYVSLGYDNNKGLVKHSSYDRYNLNTKLDINANKRIKLGLALDMSWQTSKGSALGDNPFRYAYFANPYEKPYNADGSYASDLTFKNFSDINGFITTNNPSNGYNIMRELDHTSNVSNSLNATAIANLSIKLLDNLSFEGLASYGYITNNNENINGKDTYAAWQDRPFENTNTVSTRTYSSIFQNESHNNNYNLRGQLNFFQTFNKIHYVSALLGSEIRGQYSKGLFAKRYAYDELSGNSAMPTFPEGSRLTDADLKRYAAIMDALSGQNISEERFASFYLSLDYVLNNKYIASFTARTDGSNNFGSKEQFNPTGSFGLSWNVDKEPFMEKLKPVISSLSLRTAVGFTGNINKSVYPQLMMDYSTAFRRTDTDYYRMGWIKNAPNPLLRWEKTRDMKVSVDMGMFNERLRWGVELYSRRTYDAVSDIKVLSTTGFGTQAFNTSTLANAGIELSLSAKVLSTKDWNASVNANLSYNRNKLLKYTPPTSGLSNGKYEGYPLGSIFTGRIIGIDEQTGLYHYEKRSDASFNTINDYTDANNYLFYVGTANAPTTGGYSFNVSYKSFSLVLGGNFSLGSKVLNNIKPFTSQDNIKGTRLEVVPSVLNDLYTNHLNVRRDVTNRWTVANPRTDANPRIIDAYGANLGLRNYVPAGDRVNQAALLEDVSYFKLNTLSMSYAFQDSLLKKIGVSSLGVSFTMNNLFTLTNYSGIDPETPGAVYPLARTFTFGVSVGL